MGGNALIYSFMTSPPLGSSGRSVGGGSRSPAGSADASTASLCAPCPEGAACSDSTVQESSSKPFQGPRSKSVLLSSQEGAAEGDHAEQHLNHLLHHVDLPPQVILSLLTVSIHSDVEILVHLKREGNGNVI